MQALEFYVFHSWFLHLDDIVFFLFRFLKHFFVSDFTGGALGFMRGVCIDFACGADVLVIECVTYHR